MPRGALVLVALAIVACEEPPVDPVPLPEAGMRMDAGPRLDANVVRPAGPPRIDGVLDERRWRDAVVAENRVAGDVPGRALTRLAALVVGDRLYVGVEGTLTPGDRLVVYVDAALGSSAGVTDLAALAAAAGRLDPALVQPLVLPAEVRPDLAWGTAAMPHTAVGLDDVAGWRALGSGLTRIAADTAPLVCTASACETSLPLARLGGAPPRTLGLFARIVSREGELSNQTLPTDDPGQPQRVSVVLELEEGVMSPDDGGVDGGAPADGSTEPVVVDGVVSEAEWAGAVVERNAVSSAGTPFAGNGLLALRALRTTSRLHLAVEGTLDETSAILVYVDHDVGGFDGLVMSTAVIADPVGRLDVALSKEVYTPAEVRVDFAWGTVVLGQVATAGDERMGWRDVATTPTELRAIPTARAPTACSATACETSISLTDLGVAPSATVGLFVRLGSATLDALSNQTLPTDLPTSPELVNVVLELPPR